jgi:hypothetical protein
VVTASNPLDSNVNHRQNASNPFAYDRTVRGE